MASLLYGSAILLNSLLIHDTFIQVIRYFSFNLIPNLIHITSFTPMFTLLVSKKDPIFYSIIWPQIGENNSWGRRTEIDLIIHKGTLCTHPVLRGIDTTNRPDQTSCLPWTCPSSSPHKNILPNKELMLLVKTEGFERELTRESLLMNPNDSADAASCLRGVKSKRKWRELLDRLENPEAQLPPQFIPTDNHDDETSVIKLCIKLKSLFPSLPPSTPPL